MTEKYEKHPSYGMLLFSHTHGGERELFGSSIKHNDTIRMYLKHGEVKRDMNSDWYTGRDMIVELEMSETQFAEAITNMNFNDGVPVTIRYTEKDGIIDPCPFISKHEQFEQELNKNLDKANEITNSIIDETTELFKKKGTITKSEKNRILSLLYDLSRNINGNRDFIYSMFNEQMEKTIHEAKGEIEAFIQNKMHSIAAKVIYEHNADVLDKTSQIKNPIEIESTVVSEGGEENA